MRPSHTVQGVRRAREGFATRSLLGCCGRRAMWTAARATRAHPAANANGREPLSERLGSSARRAVNLLVVRPGDVGNWARKHQRFRTLSPAPAPIPVLCTRKTIVAPLTAVCRCTPCGGAAWTVVPCTAPRGSGFCDLGLVPFLSILLYVTCYSVSYTARWRC